MIKLCDRKLLINMEIKLTIFEYIEIYKSIHNQYNINTLYKNIFITLIYNSIFIFVKFFFLFIKL
jgi:hypothetical protein